MGSVLGSANGGSVGLYMNDKPTFDPKEGFEFERKERVLEVPLEELISAKIPPKNRDYCAHHLIEYHKCRYDNFPLLYRCAHEKHHYLNCEQEDYVLRMKEFERERRLRIRDQACPS